MRGRPPKPILLKKREGDTRQRGANKHAESISSALRVESGGGDMPEELQGTGVKFEIARREFTRLCTRFPITMEPWAANQER